MSATDYIAIDVAILFYYSDIAILSIKGADCRCIISGISKTGAINLMQNADLTGKKRNIIKHKQFIFIYENG